MAEVYREAPELPAGFREGNWENPGKALNPRLESRFRSLVRLETTHTNAATTPLRLGC
jgi:hypothetical protein